MKYAVRISIEASQLLFRAERSKRKLYEKRFRGYLPMHSVRKPSALPQADFRSQQELTGTLACENGRYSLFYEEKDGSDMSGSNVDLSFSDSRKGSLYMRRSGIYRANMIFTEGKRHHFRYDTGVAPITVCTYTRKVENTVNENGGVISLEYKTDVGGILQINRLKIEVHRI